jgi:hypothetical protein
MKRALLIGLAALLLAPAARAVLPPEVREMSPPVQWRSLGQGELRWFGLKVYRAALWVGGARYSPDQPFALALTYARDIPGERLVATSLSEMERLGWGDAASLARWRVELERVFPDVREGDTIVGVNLPGRGARFFHQGRSLGEVADQEFARAFFAIWLDPRTRAPELRAQLLGSP